MASSSVNVPLVSLPTTNSAGLYGTMTCCQSDSYNNVHTLILERTSRASEFTLALYPTARYRCGPVRFGYENMIRSVLYDHEDYATYAKIRDCNFTRRYEFLRRFGKLLVIVLLISNSLIIIFSIRPIG